MVSVEKTIICDGFVTEWRYQAKTNNPFRAVIFRRQSGPSPLIFKIVGINDIPAGPINQEVVFQVPLHDRIQVEIGDMIGWSFGPGVLPYNNGGNTKVRWVRGNLHDSLEKDQVLSIDAGAGDREYSIAAVINTAIGTDIQYSFLCLLLLLLLLLFYKNSVKNTKTLKQTKYIS